MRTGDYREALLDPETKVEFFEYDWTLKRHHQSSSPSRCGWTPGLQAGGGCRAGGRAGVTGEVAAS